MHEERCDYLTKLRGDLLEQFRGRPNIEVVQRALARQLEEVYEFFVQLSTLRWLHTAKGVQLDNIGDIVVLSRADALAVSEKADQYVPMDDETYRLYLAWKIALNTSNCTHSDIRKAMRLFWERTPIYYSEDPDYPATMFFTIPETISLQEAAVFRIAAMVKAAGVALYFLYPDDSYIVTDYSGGAIFEFIREVYMEDG